jgi:peptidoglycan/xylan/chitin deacetylase (PgdA/CDA1 family)
MNITSQLEQVLFQRDVVLWSVDIDTDDWRPQTPDNLVEHTLSLLEAKHSGIVLLHDVQPHTAAAIPTLLRELKARGYSIVQAIAPDVGAKNIADPAFGTRVSVDSFKGGKK